MELTDSVLGSMAVGAVFKDYVRDQTTHLRVAVVLSLDRISFLCTYCRERFSAVADQNFEISIMWRLLLGCPQTGRVNSMDFHRTDDLLVTASDDESIRVYDTSSAT